MKKYRETAEGGKERGRVGYIPAVSHRIKFRDPREPAESRKVHLPE